MEEKDFTSLYTNEDKAILKVTEDSLNPKVDRIQELIAYSKMAKIKTIGIAYCTSVAKEATQLETILQAEGLQVEKVHCKYGKVPFNSLIEGYKGLT